MDEEGECEVTVGGWVYGGTPPQVVLAGARRNPSGVPAAKNQWAT